MIWSKVCYSNSKHQLSINWVFLIRRFLNLKKEIETLKEFVSFFLKINLINEILWINQILNSNRSKFSHTNEWHQFCTETPSLFNTSFTFIKKFQMQHKTWIFSIKHDLSMILSMSYQNSGVILSKVYYINTTYHFGMNSDLPLWRPILYLRENSKCNITAAYLSI